MSMSEWAKREIEYAIAKEREASGVESGWDYGVACYESALKAFNCLMEDGHSGMSIGFTKNILNRLIDGKVLKPIEDTEDIWSDRTYEADNYKSYQCTRMSSFFKDVYKDGTVKYHDNDRVVCVDINTGSTYGFGLVTRIVNEMYPITMPYFPANNPYKVYCEDFLFDPKNGDFDTVGIFYIIKPDGEKVEINRFFKGDDEWEEIDVVEYNARKNKEEKNNEDV